MSRTWSRRFDPAGIRGRARRHGGKWPGQSDGRRLGLVAAPVQQCDQSSGPAGVDGQASACRRSVRAGRRPESRVVDLPVTTDWPANGAVGYRGETTLKEAIASSRNAAAVRLAKELGVPAVAEVRPAPGDRSRTRSRPVLRARDLFDEPARGHGSLCGDREWRVPRRSDRCPGRRGRPREVRASYLDAQRTRVVAQKCVEPTRRILREVVQEGTGRGAWPRRGMAYGKTGTTTSNADAWFVGWAKKRVLGIWMGRQRTAEGRSHPGRERCPGGPVPPDPERRRCPGRTAATERRRTLGSVERTPPRDLVESDFGAREDPEAVGLPARRRCRCRRCVRGRRPGLSGGGFGHPRQVSPRPPDRG